MGAIWVTTMMDGSRDQASVRKRFEQLQEEDRYENGHSYSGGFGMASGLYFHEVDPFPSREAAEEFLEDRCMKWQEAWAVKCFDRVGQPARWLIGAWCAS